MPLRLGLARRAAVVGFIAPLLGVSITFWAHFYGYLPWQQFPTYEMSATYLTIVPGTWQLTVWGLETSAQQLMHQLTQARSLARQSCRSNPRKMHQEHLISCPRRCYAARETRETAELALSLPRAVGVMTREVPKPETPWRLVLTVS